MPQQRVFLDQWFNTTGNLMNPNSAVVGASGSVDDFPGDDTFVTVRAEQINVLQGSQQSAFKWFPPARPELPAYPADRNPRLDVTIRHEMTVSPTEITTEALRVSFTGVLSGFISATASAIKNTRVTASPTLFGNLPPWALTANLWNDIRNGDLEFGISNLRGAGNSIFNPVTFTPYPPGTEIRVNVYEVMLTVLWDSTHVPVRRLYPRKDSFGITIGRIYPPPDTPQASGRGGSSAPY